MSAATRPSRSPNTSVSGSRGWLAQHVTTASAAQRASSMPMARSQTRTVQSSPHPRRQYRQRPARRPGVQAQVQLALPSRQPLPRRRLQQLHLSVAMRRPQMLDLPRPAMRGVHDLHGRRARRRVDRPHVRHQATLRPAPRLAHKSGLPRERTTRSAHRGSRKSMIVIKVGANECP